MTASTIMQAPPESMIDWAIRVANESPCAKSKRGAVLYETTSPTIPINDGFNGPPYPFTCDGSEGCRRDCGRICVHAEMRAIMGLDQKGRDNKEFDLIHVKTVGGRLVGGKGPCCEICSRLVLDVGIAGVWLYEAPIISVELANVPEAGEDVPPSTWRYYSSMEFHLATLTNLNLHRVM